MRREVRAVRRKPAAAQGQVAKADQPTPITFRFAAPADGARPESLTLLLTHRTGEPQRFPFVLRDISLSERTPQ
jgi:hypothetical protein